MNPRERDKPGSLTLITGGVRSGKSRLAERLAADCGDHVTYIATMECRDDEVRDRIRAHRDRRPASWVTVEEPLNVAEAIFKCGSASDAVIVDCLGLFVSNVLLGQRDDMPYRIRCDEILEKVRQLAEAAKQVSIPVIVVSNEVGSGLVPDNLLGRIFRDAMGWANQMLAAEADRVYLTVAGIPVDVKAIGDPISLAGPEDNAKDKGGQR